MGTFRDGGHKEPIIIGREKTPDVSYEHEESLDNVLSPNERDQILKDLFEGREGAVDSSFLYKGKGAELYERISKDESYPFIEIENESLEELRYNDDFRKILEKTDHITDVGCGDGQKIIAMLGSGGPYKDRPFIPWEGTYVPEDYSWQMIDIAVKNIKKGLSHVKIGDTVRLNTGKHLSQNFSKNMYLFLGGTVCNMSDEEIIHELKNMDNNGVVFGNHILLSYFTAPNTQEEIDELIKIYNSENNRLFHENGMAMLGLSKHDFEFDTIYEKDNPQQTEGPFPGRIKGIIRARRDCAVKLSNGKEISIKKGQEFTLHYSRRFTKKGIEQLFKKSGCKVVFTIDRKGDSIALLKKKPAKFKKVRRTLRSTLIGTLVAGSLATGISSHYENEKQKEREREYTEWESGQTRGNEGMDYSQEVEELSVALQLNKLNKKDKQIVIDMFNDYVSDNKNDGTTTEELIQGFWKKYGGILIKNFDIKHPYYSITPEMITNTNNLDEEISYTPERESNGRIRSNRVHENYGTYYPVIEFIQGRGKSRVLEYNDGGENYYILKLRVTISGEETEIYVAVKGNDINYSCPPYSTDVINDIKDTSGLDPVIISNTKNLEGSFVLRYVDRFGTTLNSKGPILTYSDDNKIVDMGALRESRIKPIALYLGEGKMYYIITVPTQGGGKIGLASKTIDGKYTTTLFNEISEEFSRARILF